VALIKTTEKKRRKGLARKVIADLRAFMEEEAKGKHYDSCYIAANVDVKYRPGGFFKQAGFTKDAPVWLKCWKEGACMLMVLKVFDVEDSIEH
jgi:hypothetical protein